MIFPNIKELKAAIYRDHKAFKFPFEQSDVNDDFFNPHPETFEAVLVDERSKEKLLIPSERYYTYLYRGQSGEHTPCIPQIYRDSPSDAQIFIERMKLVEFSNLLNTHPVVEHFFNRHNFRVDHTGLAQHYGIKTDVLDFTSNLDIAIFFAVCPHDDATDSYTYIDDDKEHEAIIYVILPLRCSEEPMSVFSKKIYPIGLQPLIRPGMQRGFGLNLKQGESFNGFIFRFKYSAEDSKFYYDKYQQGKTLWSKDDLIDKAKSIIEKREFSYRIFKQAWDRYRAKGCSKTQMKKLLNREGVYVSNKYTEERFTPEEILKIITEWNSGKGADIVSKITRRGWITNAESYIDKATLQRRYMMEKKHLYRTLKVMGQDENLRVFLSDVLTTCGEPINYNTEYAEKHYKRDSKVWRDKVEGTMIDIFSRCYLEESDYIIKPNISRFSKSNS